MKRDIQLLLGSTTNHLVVLFCYIRIINTAQHEFYRRNITIRNIGLTKKKHYKLNISFIQNNGNDS